MSASSKMLDTLPTTESPLAPPAAHAADRAGSPPKTERLPMVLHVRVVTGHGGGPEKTILNSPRFLPALGYQSKLAYLHPPGDPGIDALRERGASLGAEVLSVPDRGPLDLAVVRRLATLLKQHQVAIWHAHDYKSNALGLLLRWWWPMKLVTTLHGWTNMSGRMPLYAKVDRWCLKHYAASICVSDDLREACQECRVPAERTHVIYNAIDTHDYRRTRSVNEAKRRLGAYSSELLIGAVGRLSPEKGFDQVIRATVALRRQGQPVALWIAGEGSAREELERLIGELRCGDYVRLLGHVANPQVFYEAMDVYVLSSIREGLPNVVLEAMAMEVPVVATRVAGVPQLVEDGASGLIVPTADSKALIAGIERLLSDAALRERFARAGRTRIESHFSFDRRMERVARLYDQVLGRSGIASAS